MSGFTPGVTLRKTFISESSPKATEEFDCSPENSVECAVEVEVVPGQRWKSSSPREVLAGGAANARSHSAIDSRSCSAS